jgi:hypothetical protein
MASCEEENEDVIDLHAFVEPGINPKIDEAFEAQQAAQMAMQVMVRSSSDDSSSDVPVPAVKAGSQALSFAEAQQRYNQLHSPPVFLPELPALASASELETMDAAAAASLAPSAILFANKKRATARMEHSRRGQQKKGSRRGQQEDSKTVDEDLSKQNKLKRMAAKDRATKQKSPSSSCK